MATSSAGEDFEMHCPDVAAVIMAGGKGKRMGDGCPKVFRRVNGKAMLARTLNLALQVAAQVVVVLSPGSYQYMLDEEPQISEWIQLEPRVHVMIQSVPRGTGDAALQGLRNLDPGFKYCLILSGDTPLLKVKTVLNLVDVAHQANAHAVMAVAKLETSSAAHGYGRVIVGADGHTVQRVVEQKELNRLLDPPADVMHQLRLVNGGIYVVCPQTAPTYLDKLHENQETHETYLPEAIVAMAQDAAINVQCQEVPRHEILNVNTPQDLEAAEDLGL
jgi:bifunctional UDP-N-acetylglucosamine pyrophosphorylase/glucosamine-1-phosphate N-acetyltransferase